MARIRTIKPEFFTSEDIVSLTPLARVFYIGTWCEADREGRLEWKPGTLKMRYLPGDQCDVQELAGELTGVGLIVLYQVDGKTYAEIPTFRKHQVINNREAESTLPPRVVDASSTRLSRVKAEGREGRKEGKGRNSLAPIGACPPAVDDGMPDPGECGGASSSEPGYEVPDCPHVEIVATYHEVLPMLPRVEVLNDARRGMLRQRWREVCTEEKFNRDEALAWWRDYFAFAGQSKFLTGQARPKQQGDPPFLADFEWLIRPQNFAKVIEKRYHRRAA